MSGDLLKWFDLWEATSASGRRYLRGRAAGLRVLVMENRNRGQEDQPDYTLFVAPVPDQQQDRPQQPRRTGGQQQRKQLAIDAYAPRREPPRQPELDDDISDIGAEL